MSSALLAEVFAQTEAAPDRSALIQTGSHGAFTSWTCAEFASDFERVAAGLRSRGICDGCRTVIMVPPSRDFFSLIFACFLAGAVPVLIDPGLERRKLRACLERAQPEAFIGVAAAHIARILLRWTGRLERRVTVGSLALFGARLAELRDHQPVSHPSVDEDELAAILFTSGSTGPPKGVCYKHRHFAAQLHMLRSQYGMQPGEVDLATFPPFALFDPGLGMTTVLPRMDFRKPAQADPAHLVALIRDLEVSNVFASPALLTRLAHHVSATGERFGQIRRIISAGASVPLETVRTIGAALVEPARLHTPYGATEALPVSDIDGQTIIDYDENHRIETGVPIGTPLTANTVRIAPIDDGELSEIEELPVGEVGEICVRGPSVTESYAGLAELTRLAKVHGSNGIWHRMGDLGFADANGALWYVGRKNQRVETADGLLFTELAEAWMCRHSAVAKAALVGVGQRPAQRAVMVVELAPAFSWREQRTSIIEHLRLRGQLSAVEDVLSYPRALPVDIRHNAKIRREALAQWAAGKLG